MESLQPSISERVQLIAIGSHNIADRFTAQNEALGIRIRGIASSLIEDAALFYVAQKRDALGANRLIHKIFGHMEALRALLEFSKQKGFVMPISVDIVVWHIGQAVLYFEQQDYKLEQHSALAHPQDSVVSPNIFDKPKIVKDVMAHDSIEDEGSPELKNFDLPFTQNSLDNEPYPFNPQARSSDFVMFEKGGEMATATLPASPLLKTLKTFSFSEARPSPGQDRQKRLVDYFAVNKEAKLKDILTLFPDISEKTVRNDLAELCRAGVLKRIGLAPRSYYISSVA